MTETTHRAFGAAAIAAPLLLLASTIAFMTAGKGSTTACSAGRSACGR